MIYQKFITQTLIKASQTALNNFEKVKGIRVKGQDNNQVLTETDIEIGNLIVSEIKRTYPKYNIIDEETGVIDNKSDFTWVVDPIDGTSNFASSTKFFRNLLWRKK